MASSFVMLSDARAVISGDHVRAIVRTPLAPRGVLRAASLAGHPGSEEWSAVLRVFLDSLPVRRLILALGPDLAVPREVPAPKARRLMVETVLRRHVETIDPRGNSVILAVVGDVHRDRAVVVTVDETLLMQIIDAAQPSVRSVTVVSAVESFARQCPASDRVITAGTPGNAMTFGIRRRVVVSCSRGGDDEKRIAYVRQRTAEMLSPRRRWRWLMRDSAKPIAAGEPGCATLTWEAFAWGAARGAHRAIGRLLPPAEVGRRHSVELRRFRRTAVLTGFAFMIAAIVEIASAAAGERRIRTEQAALMPAVTALRAELQSAVDVHAELVEWGALADASPRWASLLVALADALPEQAVLTRLSARGDTLMLEGRAPDAGTALTMLRRVNYLAGVELTAPPVREPGDQPGEAFAMRARILPRDSLR